MVKIHRIWFNTERMDREDYYKITLFSRPRVSIHVDEYIWSFIEENIVKPHKLMRSEKHEYLLDIAFGQFDPAKHRYFPLSSYNGLLREGVEMDSANRSYFREDFAGGKDRTTWFSPNKIWTNCGDKVLNVDIKAANVSENITPREYADMLFDGIGAALPSGKNQWRTAGQERKEVDLQLRELQIPSGRSLQNFGKVLLPHEKSAAEQI